MSRVLAREILREYDIRGTYGTTLFDGDAYAIGLAFAERLHAEAGSIAGMASPAGVEDHTGEEDPVKPARHAATKHDTSRQGPAEGQGRPAVVVGLDGRLSSPALEAALVAGLSEGGVDVVRIGLAPTPMLYFAEAVLGSARHPAPGASEAEAPQVRGGIHVTGSHNPRDDNGFKIVLGGRPFFGEALEQLGLRAAAIQREIGLPLGVPGEIGLVAGSGAPARVAGRGTVQTIDLMDRYIDRLLEGLDGVDLAPLAGLRIGWDAGNGAAGPAIEALTRRLPGEHHLLYTTVDGHFPHHHPDPTVEANLADLRSLVAAKHLDFGVAFDGDADRVGLVDGEGRIVWGDQILMILAEDVLAQVPGATIVADVKSSAALFRRISALGGRADMWKTGHSLVKSRMKAIGAALGGEMTGHLFFAHRFYGHDDGLYAAVRLIAATQRLGRSITQLRGAMPALVNTPELRFPAPEGRKFAVVDEVRDRLLAQGLAPDTTDGVRVTTPDGWWLLRASNTQAGLTARAEADDQAGLERLLAGLQAQLAQSGIGWDPKAGH